MSKVMITPSSKDMIEKTLEYTDAYLIGVKNFSVNLPFYFKEDGLEEIIKSLKENKKEVFLNINKNMFSKDLKELEIFLERVENMNVDGICFYDISVVSIMRKKGFKTPLIWHQEHFTTNYLTIDYWMRNGVKTCFLSNEITQEEIEEIRLKTSSKLILQAFGYVPIFLSKRPLVTNYKNYFLLNDNSKIYYMEKEGLKYPLREFDGTFEAYNAKVLNSLEKLKEKNIDYLYLNSFLIEEDKFIKILSNFKNNNFSAIYELYEEELGFLEQKTVYRVKDL